MDFLRVLGKQSGHMPIVSKIFSYMDGSDLQNVTRVSKTWKELCLLDRESSMKLRRYVAKRKMTKENPLLVKHPSIQSCNESTPKKRRVLKNWKENFQFTQMKVTPNSPPVSPRSARFNIYLKEAMKLNKTEKLMPCPKCTLPSNVNEEESSGKCTKPSCSFYFCVRCQCPYHRDSNCKYFITSSPTSSPSKASKYSVGSRQSRKALRRL